MTLDEYRHRVKQLEEEVRRCNLLYTLAIGDSSKKALDRAKKRLARAQKYLRKREIQEDAV